MVKIWLMTKKRMLSGALTGLDIVGGYSVPTYEAAVRELNEIKERMGTIHHDVLTDNESVLLHAWIEHRDTH